MQEINGNFRIPNGMCLMALLLAVIVGGCKKDDNGGGPSPDTTPPAVSSTNPANGATGVAVITAAFSEAMDASTINTTTFMVHGPGVPPIVGSVTYDATSYVATFTPSSSLPLSTAFVATITTGAKDAAGNALASDYVWNFSTAATTAGQGSVVLGGAGNFAVLAGSAVASTGATSLTGDLGMSPGSAVTGFPPGIIVGTQHVNDPLAVQAKLDLTTAYNDAAGRTVGPIAVAGNIGGLTLPPGLYKSNSSLAISSGDLTLNAQGDTNAVFIFQIASTLTTTSGRKVILSGGAKASNIFWQVGTSATLGTTSVFKGTIMTDQSITMSTGASLEGRALTRIAAVTLAGNTIVRPTP